MEDKKQIKDKVILHSDVNNFYASVECSYHPELRDKPVAVTGNPEKRTGIILAKNEIAKKFGIKTGQVIGEAKALCPELVCLAPHYELYEEISTALHNLYLEYTNFVEPLGLDECWLDVTGSIKYLKKSGVEIANEIRERVKKDFGLTVSVGVSFSKIFAKLGSDLKKPDYTTVISYDNYKKITYGLPLNSIIGIGKRLENKFSSIDVNTIGDFVKLDDEYLNRLMGNVGINLKKDLLAERNADVCDYYKLPPPKSIGNGTTTTKDIVSREEIKKVIYFLAEKVSFRMLKHNVYANTLSLTIKDNNLKTVHKSSKILPTNEITSLSNYALAIADKIWKYNRPVRAVRLRASSLTSANIKQLSMFDGKSDFSFALKEINQKYGKIELASDMEKYLNKQSHFQK